MTYLFKFLLIFTFVYLVLKSFVRFLTGKRRRQPPPRQQQHSYTRQPEKQEDRIIEYQKKNFEHSDVEDVEFVEIKKKDNE
jgi:hypothetical protein